MSSSTNKEHAITMELEPMMESPARYRSNSNTRTRLRTGRDIGIASSDAELIPPETHNNRNRPSIPPKAQPELEDDDDDDNLPPMTPTTNPGVDDGFFVTRNDDGAETDQGPDNEFHPNGIIPRRRPSLAPFPYSPGFEPNNPGFRPISPGFGTGLDTPIPDVNVYQHKKTLAQGMMDLALLSANANQLRYVLESYKRHPYYYVSLSLISISIFFQIAVGVGLIWNSRFNVKNEKEMCRANKINNFTVIGIFVVTVVNVFISAFGVADPPPDMNG